jgi:hypothetical protein
MQMLHHCNVVTLVDSFFTNDNTDKVNIFGILKIAA